MTPDDLHWFHSIDLGNGQVTRGTKPREDQERKATFLPASFEGRRVLDVGARDGVYSFTAEERGASEVVAVEPVPTAGFHYARAMRGSKVELVPSTLEAYEPERPFDIVICYGVLYHVDDPAGFLSRLVELAGERLYLETAVFPSLRGRARLHDNRRLPLYPDTSTYLVPTVGWVRRHLRALGARVDRERTWVGGGLKRRVPLVRALPAPARLVPSRLLVEARAEDTACASPAGPA